MAGYEKINVNVANIFNKYGSTPINAVMDYLTGGDNIQLYGSEYAVDINTKTTIRSGKYFFKDSDNSHTSQFLFDDAINDQTVVIPALTNEVTGLKKDTVVFLNQSQAFENKDIDITKNAVMDPNANISHLATFDAQGHLTKIASVDVIGTLDLPDATTEVKGVVEFSLSDGSESAGGKAVQDNDARLGAGGPHSHDWADVIGEPATYPPEAHDHVWADITDPPATYAPSSHAYSSHTGIPSTFAPSAHSHDWADVTGEPSTYAPSAHASSHSSGQGDPITLANLAGDLDWSRIVNEPATYAPSSHSYASHTDIPSTFAPSAHNHAGDDINSGTVGASYLPTANTTTKGAVILATNNEATAGEVVQSDDSRLSNARTPTAHGHDWADITGEPATYAPSLHAASHGDNGGDEIALDWSQITTGVPSTFAPSAHDHVWADITDPPATYAPTAHGHDWADITGEPATYAPSAHNHAAGDINSGELAVVRGGTGKNSITQHALIKGGATNTYTEIAPAADGKVLKMVAGTPAWADEAGGAHTHTIAAIDDGGASENYVIKIIGGVPSWAPDATGEGSGIQNISEADDVTLTSLQDGQILEYDTGTTDWINVNHDHSALFAAIGHDHDADYSAIGHDHAGVYSVVAHDHAGVYAPNSHTHDWADITGEPLTYAPSAHASSHGNGGTDEIAIDWSQITTGVPSTFAPSTHNHSGEEITSGTVPAAQLPTANTTTKGAVILAVDGESAAGEAVQANDTRLSNARTPSAHTHLWVDTTDKPTTFAPSAHATAHKTGGGDAIKLDELATPTDITTLNATTALHGLLKKLSNVATEYMNGQGNWTVPAVSTHATSHKSGGGDAIKLDELAAPTDITTLNATTSLHGLLPKLATTPYQVLRINSGGNGSEWASLDSERTGTATATANGSTTVFNIAHGLGGTPYCAFVECSTHTGPFTRTEDSTNIVITYGTAPPSSPATIKFHWRAIQ